MYWNQKNKVTIHPKSKMRTAMVYLAGVVLSYPIYQGLLVIEKLHREHDAAASETLRKVYRAGFDRNAALPGRAATCFGNQIPPDRDGVRIERATVLLKSVNPEEQIVTGTGTVVRNSEDASGNNMILTAYHVVRDAGGAGAVIEVTNSFGDIIGSASPMAWARVRPGSGPHGYDGGDVAVLGMTFLSLGKEFTTIEGLDLAPWQEIGMLSGPVYLPGGVQNGASGAALVDGNGNIVGVLDIGSIPPNDVPVAVVGGFPSPGTWSEGMPGTRIIGLPSRSTGYAETITDPDVLASLGKAGSEVRVGVGPPSTVPLPVIIPSFPYGNCIVYTASFAAMPDGASR